jgi:hypothetical protein
MLEKFGAVYNGEQDYIFSFLISEKELKQLIEENKLSEREKPFLDVIANNMKGVLEVNIEKFPDSDLPI